jgi:endonuclease/exonuclease/phosphatase family metal-dependent hydrolase
MLSKRKLYIKKSKKLRRKYAYIRNSIRKFRTSQRSNKKNIKLHNKIRKYQYGGGKTINELKAGFTKLVDDNITKTIPVKPENVLRLATFNIHYFTDVTEGKDTYLDVIADIEKINADVIVLQEVIIGGNNIVINEKVTLNLADMFSNFESKGYKKIINCNSVPSWFASNYGNIMLVKNNYCSDRICVKLDESNFTFEKALTSTTVSGSHTGTKETRCYIYVKVIFNNITYHIIGTHLDVASEDTRLNQIRTIDEKYASLKNGNDVLVIMGDFNTFDMDQYRGTDYESSSFTKDNGKVYSYLTQHGYFDLTSSPPPMVTTWNLTRVDFIFSSQRLNYDHYLMFTHSSDHLPVIVDIKSIST